MTVSLASSLLTGSAPPANAPPGLPSTTGSAAPTDGFASLLTAAAAATQAGSVPTPPPGGTSTQVVSSDASLLAQLLSLLTGETAGLPGVEAITHPLLDRPAGAGEEAGPTGPDAPEVSMAAGTLESLMAYLMTTPHVQPEPAPPLLAGPLTAGETLAGPAGAVASGNMLEEAVPAPVVPVTPMPDEMGAPSSVAVTALAEDGDLPAPAVSALSTPAAGQGSELSPGTAETGPAVGMDRALTSTPRSDGDAAGEREQRDAVPSPAMSADIARPATRVDTTPALPATPAVTMVSPQRVEAASGVIQPVRVVDATVLPSAVAETVQAAVLTGEGEVRLVLNPPDLGHLDVSVVTREGALQIRIEASQAGARELIDRSLPALHLALEARDLRVDRLEVRATEAGRGMDASAGGQHPGWGEGRGAGSGEGDGSPEWSPIAAIARGESAVTAAQTQAGGGVAVDGRVDVLA